MGTLCRGIRHSHTQMQPHVDAAILGIYQHCLTAMSHMHTYLHSQLVLRSHCANHKQPCGDTMQRPVRVQCHGLKDQHACMLTGCTFVRTTSLCSLQLPAFVAACVEFSASGCFRMIWCSIRVCGAVFVSVVQFSCLWCSIRVLQLV